MNILLVDDHPVTVEGYLIALTKEKKLSGSLVFEKAYSCETASQFILDYTSKGLFFDIAIIDLDLPGCIEPSLASGKELALYLKSKMPSVKIIIITAHIELIIVYDVWKSVRPDGFVIKNDLTPELLLKIVEDVSEGLIYKSPMFENCIREIWKKELIVEDYNRQIIYYLSLGFRVKDLHDVIPISQGAIQKRMVKINSVFEVTDKEGLLREVKRLGFI